MVEEEVPSKWQRYSNVIASDPSLALALLSTLSLASLSVKTKRERESVCVCVRERERHSKISEGKNNARYSWGNHLTSNLFCSLSLICPRMHEWNIWLIQ